MNEEDIVNDKKIFAYSPVFAVSSFGTGQPPKHLENVVMTEEIVKRGESEKDRTA